MGCASVCAMKGAQVNVRLVLALRRQDPYCGAENNDYQQSNKGCPTAMVSIHIKSIFVAPTHPFAIVYVESWRSFWVGTRRSARSRSF
jgi:hypothetical protein